GRGAPDPRVRSGSGRHPGRDRSRGGTQSVLSGALNPSFSRTEPTGNSSGVTRLVDPRRRISRRRRALRARTTVAEIQYREPPCGRSEAFANLGRSDSNLRRTGIQFGERG